MQLVAYGAQDIYLTGNPQITFFKVVYRRHTNFSMESIRQTFNGQNDLGGKVTATISRNGDLIHRMYVTCGFSKTGPITRDPSINDISMPGNLGTSLFKEIELEIGGQKIDRLYGDWLETWAELTEVNPHGLTNISTAASDAFTDLKPPNHFSGNTLYQKMTGSGGTFGESNPSASYATLSDLTIPLPFWFCRNVGLALPLIALQYHEVKIMIQYNTATAMGSTSDVELSSNNLPSLWVDYIYLDTDERRRFAQVSHEYLIEQVQRLPTNENSNGSSILLNFNHPVKELIWIGKPVTTSGSVGASTPQRWVDNNQAVELQLRLNGHDRFEKRNGLYFTRCQIWQHHTGFGGNIHRDSIGVYSFALKPEEHQPSGSCNFSRIDDARLHISGGNLNSSGLIIYAVNYNVLRIMSGMGGLAYSN